MNRLVLALLALLLFGGCASLAPIADVAAAAVTRSSPSGTPPLVTSSASSSATLILTACPVRPDTAVMLNELITVLSQQSPVVTATEAGVSRLVLNLCPYAPTPEMLRALATANQQRR